MRTRSEARTENGWEAFDRMAGLVSLALVLVLLALSLVSTGVVETAPEPLASTASAPAAPAAPAPQAAAEDGAEPVFERIPTHVDAPVQAGSGDVRPSARDASLVVPILDLRATDGKLTIDGIVGSDQTRKAIVRAALERFGMRNITDRVAVSAGIGEFSWTSDPKDIMVLVGRPEQATSVRIDGRTVTLTGTLAERADKEARGLAAQQLFGPTATIDNRIRVARSGESTPVAQASPVLPGRIDLQGAGEPVRASGPVPVGQLPAATAQPAASASAPATPEARPEPLIPEHDGEPLHDGNTVLTADVPKQINISQCARISTGLVIPFRSGRATLTDDGRAALKAVAPCLERRRYIVGGHTDSRGDADANMVLSQERAQAVVDFLVANGVSPDQLVAKGYGETRPVDTNRNEKGRARNRRIDFRFAD